MDLVTTVRNTEEMKSEITTGNLGDGMIIVIKLGGGD